MKGAAVGAGFAVGGAPLSLLAQGIDDLVIANNVNLPSWGLGFETGKWSLRRKD